MRTASWILLIALVASANAEDVMRLRQRRQLAATAYRDGILFIHANPELNSAADGFRQDPFFYYFTGLANTIGAVLAIDGMSGETWLFLPSHLPLLSFGLQAEVQPGADAAKRTGIDHVVEWSELDSYLVKKREAKPTIYYTTDLFGPDPVRLEELPPSLSSYRAPRAPLWIQAISQRSTGADVKEVGEQTQALMAVQDPNEIAASRSAARATVSALMAGMHAIRPGVSQRSVESVVEHTCWTEGAHGVSFWPWAMAGDNAVFPRPFFSSARYDHLDRKMQPNDLVRLDVGCEWDHYQGDLGRTVPVSGQFTADQRETWNIFVAAYHAGVRVLRDGTTVDQVFDAWSAELLRHRASAHTLLAQRAIDSWARRENVPYWQVHTTNLMAAFPRGPLRAGTTINFEPIASIDGQGFFMEDMYLITKDGAELLTPGVPSSPDEIERAMK